MKKYLVLLSVIAVLALTVTAFAATQIDLNGDIRLRGEINDNLSDFANSGSDDVACSTDATKCSDHNSSYNTRVRLGAKATVSPNTYGVIELESGDGSSDTWTWGGLDSKRGSMAIRQAWISHSFGKVATLHAGHMLLSLGNKLFFDHTKYGDDAIALIVPVGDGNLTLLTIKLDDATGLFSTSTAQNDDVDAYVIAYGTPIGKVNLSADATHLRWHDKGANDNGNRLTNIGVRADADLGGAKIKGDFEYQFGKFGATSPSGDDLKARGLVATLGAEIPAGPVSVRANVAYGSGDKIDTDDKYEGYMNFLGDNQYYTYIYEYKTVAASGGKHTGLNNTWYLNAGVTAKPMTDLTLSGDLYYLRAVKEISDADDMDSKAIGVELDAKATLQLDTNLVYYVEAGYLWAGDFYANVTGDKGNVDNPYSVRQGLQLSF